MIGALKGTIMELQNNQALLFTASGVGYNIYVTPRFIQGKTLPFNTYVKTYLCIKEDSHTLYAFENNDELKLFQLLLNVDGIGPKTAFAVISYAQSNQILTAIQKGDLSYFMSIPGLGKKTAQKLLIELSNKVDPEFYRGNILFSEQDKLLIDALSSLGFSRSDAHKVMQNINRTNTIEEQIKEAIQKLTKA